MSDYWQAGKFRTETIAERVGDRFKFPKGTLYYSSGAPVILHTDVSDGWIYVTVMMSESE